MTSKFILVNRSYQPEKEGKRDYGLTMPLHYAQKFYNNLGGWTNQDLPLASPFGVDDVVL
jgi:hypothetical protein